MRSGNPTLNANTFRFEEDLARNPANVMTLNGTAGKTLALLACVVLTGSWTWHIFDAAFKTNQDTAAQAVAPWLIGGLIGGLVFALITIFKKTAAPFTAPAYALCEGLLLGGVSAMFELKFPGIVVQAVGLTFGTLFTLLMLYITRVIKPTENFKLGVVAATGGIALLYLASFILGMFGMPIGFIHNSTGFGIAFSVFVVIIAALNLVLDFDFIEQGAAQGAPKYMEWYAAFGLMVTLVWLYLEILRLLAKLRDR